MPRTPLRAVLVTVTTAVAAVGLIGTAGAAAASPTGVIVGDVTGDGRADRTVLTNTGTPDHAICVAVVRSGRADGTFARGRPVVLPVPANAERPDGFQRCPVDGVVMRGASARANRLAVVYDALVGPGRGVDVFSLIGSHVTTGTAAWVADFAGYGDAYGVVDLDGRGVDDDWWSTTTDSVAGGVLFTRSGDSWTPTYSTGHARSPAFTFVDLDHGAGTDAVVTTVSDGSAHPFAAAVDGRSGRVRVLATGDPFGQPAVTAFRAAVTDLDGDTYPDVVVTPVHVDGTAGRARSFLNRSQDGHLRFVRG